MLFTNVMAEGVAEMTTLLSAEDPQRKDKIVKLSPEDYNLEKKDYTALKVICLGDSAVGKSK